MDALQQGPLCALVARLVACGLVERGRLKSLGCELQPDLQS